MSAHTYISTLLKVQGNGFLEPGKGGQIHPSFMAALAGGTLCGTTIWGLCVEMSPPQAQYETCSEHFLPENSQGGGDAQHMDGAALCITH